MKKLIVENLKFAHIPGTQTVIDAKEFNYFFGFKMGNGMKKDLESDYNEEWPSYIKPIKIPDFEITTFPITVALYKEFILSGGYMFSDLWSREGNKIRKQRTVSYLRKWWNKNPNHPVTEVCWYEAEAFCNWLCRYHHVPFNTYRLPTEAEWEWVARGPDANYYPWGDKWNDFCCNWVGHPYESTNPEGMFTTGVAKWWKKMNQDALEVWDLSGNVIEWTATLFSNDYYYANESVLNEDLQDWATVTMKGGSYKSSQGEVRAAKRFIDYPGFFGLDVGFRIVRVS